MDKIKPQSVEGKKGGKGGGGSTRAAVEAPNTLQSRATARVIDIVSHGECVGLADRDNPLRSVYYDGLPVEGSDGVRNWEGVVIQERLGLPGQEPFNGFDEIEDETVVNLEITTNWPRTIRVTDSSVSALRFKIRIPSLSHQDKKTGDLNGTSVSYRFETRPLDGAWTTVANEYLSAKCTTPQELSYRIDRPDLGGQGGWEARVVRMTPSTDDVTLQNKTYLASVTQLIEANLQYADMAGCAQQADSAQFGDRIPPRAFDWVGMVLDVPSNYTPPQYDDPLNPNHRKYTGLWDGTFKRAWTDNPAWVLWGLLTNPEWGLGRQVKPSQVDKWELYQIAKYCDELVPDGRGGLEPRYRINTQIVKAESAYATLQAVASIFRGMLYWGSGTVSFVCDQPKDPVKLVSPANTLDGEFTYAGTSLKNRHTVARVTWNDPEDDYKQSIEVIEDAEMIDRYGYRPVDVTAFGCTSRSQANRMGRWILDTERYETETVSYRASFDHADVRPGQIVEIYDPHYAGVRMGGRLVDITSTSATLDAPVTLEAGQSYTISLVREDGSLVSRPVTNGPGEHSVLNWTSSLDTLPATGTATIFATAVATQRSQVREISTTSVTFYNDLQIEAGYQYYVGFTLPSGAVVTRQISAASLNSAIGNDGKSRTFSWSAPLGTLPSVDSVAFLYAPSEGFTQRAISSHTPTSATLSTSYEIKSGYDYEVIMSYADDSRVVRKLTNEPGFALILTWKESTASLPIKGSMWGLTATNLSPREFRVLGVKEIDPNKFEITALNYDRNKYDRVEQGLFLEPEGTTKWTSTTVPEPPGNITAHRRPVIKNNEVVDQIHVFWEPSPSMMVTHYRVAYRFEDGEWVYLPDSISGGAEFESKGEGMYTFMVTAVNIAGKESRASIARFSLSGRALSEPVITNLRIVGQLPEEPVFSGRDLKVTWDVQVPSNWWTVRPDANPVDPEAPPAETTDESSWEDPYLKDYVVKVLALDDTELGTFYVKERQFTLDYILNKTLGQGSPKRAVKIAVALRDVDDVVYDFTNRIFNNPAPAAPASIKLTDTSGVLSIDVAACEDDDYFATRVWVSEDPDFNPLTTPHALEGPQNQFVFTASTGVDYWVCAAYLDTFTDDSASLAISSKFTTKTKPIDVGQIADDILEQADQAIADAELRLGARLDQAETLISDAQQAADDAFAAAQLKTRTFRQDDEPTNPSNGLPLVAGDLWIDSNDANRLYRFNGTSWVNATPAGTRTYAQNDAPTGASDGDIWFDTDDNMRVYRWAGAAWVEVTDGRISSVYTTIQQHSTQIEDLENNKASTQQLGLVESAVQVKNRTFIGGTAPSNPSDGLALVTGDLWMNTANNNVISRWSGTAWDLIADLRGDAALSELVAARAGETSLSARLQSMVTSYTDGLAGKAGLIAFESIKTEVENARGASTNLSQRLQTLVSSIDGKAEQAEVNTLTSTVGVKNRTFTGSAEPTNPTGGYALVAGDLWMNTADNNVIRRWSGSAWVLHNDQRGQQALDEVTAARDGAASLSAKLTQMSTTFSDALAGKADTTVVSAIEASATARNRTFIGGTAPTSPQGGYALVPGDLWMNTSNNNVISRWSGSAWDAMHDVRGQTALNEIVAARGTETSLSAKLSAMTTAYTDLAAGKAGAEEFNTLNAEVVNARGGAASLANRLTSIVTDINGKASATSVSNLESTVSVKNRTFVSGTAPSNPSGGFPLVAGDLWMNSSANNVISRWSGSAWTAVHDARGQQALDEIITARGGQSTLSAKISSVETTLTNAINGKASAESVTSLTTTVSGHTSSIQTLQQTTSSIDGQVRSIVSLKQEANGVISGYQSINNGVTSSFKIQADVFEVVPSATGAKFSIQNGKITITNTNNIKVVELGIGITA